MATSFDNDGRYAFPGTPLTDRQRELLGILQEECAEVIQAASKLIRFGIESYPGYGENRQVLGLEIGDLQEMITLVGQEQLISVVDVTAGQVRKRDRLKRFMKNV
jgi:hypothetical protein